MESGKVPVTLCCFLSNFYCNTVLISLPTENILLSLGADHLTFEGGGGDRGLCTVFKKYPVRDALERRKKYSVGKKCLAHQKFPTPPHTNQIVDPLDGYNSTADHILFPSLKAIFFFVTVNG